ELRPSPEPPTDLEILGEGWREPPDVLVRPLLAAPRVPWPVVLQPPKRLLIGLLPGVVLCPPERGGRSLEEDCGRSLRVSGGEQCRHRSALRDAHDGGSFRANGVHHSAY